MNNEALNLLIIALVLAAAVFIFIRIALRVRKVGGSMTTIMHASTYEFLSKDNREAIDEIVETNAGNKMNEEKFGETKE